MFDNLNYKFYTRKLMSLMILLCLSVSCQSIASDPLGKILEEHIAKPLCGTGDGSTSPYCTFKKCSSDTDEHCTRSQWIDLKDTNETNTMARWLLITLYGEDRLNKIFDPESLGFNEIINRNKLAVFNELQRTSLMVSLVHGPKYCDDAKLSLLIADLPSADQSKFVGICKNVSGMDIWNSIK